MKLLEQNVNRIGMGCWAIGGPFFSGDTPLGFANTDDAMSIRTIHAAVDAGISVFDTAAVYGAGHAEYLLGNALQKHPDALIISKLGEGIDEETKQITGPETDRASVGRAIDSCLRRLKRDRVDIMLLHLNSLRVEQATPMFEQMERAREAGKVRAYGWSTDFPDSAVAMASMPGFVAVEHAMNVFIDVPTMQKTLEQLKLAALIRSPLAMGVLTGKYGYTDKMPGDDVRSINNDRRDYFVDGKASRGYLDNLAAIRELLQSDGRTIAQGALCWLLARSKQNLPLPGARTVEQVQENAAAIEFGALPEEVMTEIDRLVVREPEGPPRTR